MPNPYDEHNVMRPQIDYHEKRPGRRGWLEALEIVLETIAGRGPRRREAPSYRDLHVTTKDIRRTSVCDLPYGYTVICTRTGGWELTQATDRTTRVVAGEYDGVDMGLRLDVAGYVIVDSIAYYAKRET